MTMLNAALPLASALLSLVFAALVLDQWVQRRQSFQIAWALGLLSYAIGAATEFAGASFGWSDPLYRAWYLFGALLVAAYLGAGTVYLLSRTAFGYFAAVSVFAGGLFALLSQQRLVHEGHPAAAGAVYLVLGCASLAAFLIGWATSLHRGVSGHAFMGLLGVGTIVATVLVATATLPAPGFQLDPATHVPVGGLMPGHLRLLSAPFNIAGALCLIFGALYSTYVYMPKRKLLRARVSTPVVGQLYDAARVAVNLIASLPGVLPALLAGRLNSRVPATILIALGGAVPSITSGLNRFGVTWSFFLGEFLGVLLIFAGFLVSEEVFTKVRMPAGWILWERRPAKAALR